MKNVKFNRHIPTVGMKFGKLTTILKIKRGYYGQISFWLCICDCGKEVRVRRLDLLDGKCTECWSCGHDIKVKRILSNSSFVDINELRNT